MQAQRASQRAYEIPITTFTNNENDNDKLTILADVVEVKLGEYRAVLLVIPTIVISPFAAFGLASVGFSIFRSWLLG